MKANSGFLLAAALFGGQAVAAAVTPVSGYEISPGITFSGATFGVTFAGWTAPSANQWWPIVTNTGGSWYAVANYTGDPGIGGSVTVFGGHWGLEANGAGRSGRILRGGRIQWPETGVSDIGCGPGVATIDVPISQGDSRRPAGRLIGCLDDTHLDRVFPPQTWGRIQLN